MTRSFTPKSLDEALGILADKELGAVPVAGCTDLMVVDRASRRRHGAVLDLLRIPELQGITAGESHIDIGAACTFSSIRHDPGVRAELPMLAEAAAGIGGWQIQNRATIGGNIVNASPAGDSLPVLLALDAELLLASSEGQRTVPYDSVHTGYRQTALRPGEIVVRVRLPRPSPGAVQVYRKVGTREAQAISKIAVAMTTRRTEGRLTSVRMATASVAAVPVRLAAAEQAVEGKVPDPETAGAAGAAAAAEVSPIDDVRSTADYRRFVLGRVVRRLVLQAAEQPQLL